MQPTSQSAAAVKVSRWFSPCLTPAAGSFDIPRSAGFLCVIFMSIPLSVGDFIYWSDLVGILCKYVKICCSVRIGLVVSLGKEGVMESSVAGRCED